MATEIGSSAFPGGTWIPAADGAISAELCPAAPAGTIATSRVYLRRDVAGGTSTIRMAIFKGDGSERYGVSDDYVINDANATGGTFVWTNHTIPWSSPGVIPSTEDVLLVVQYAADCAGVITTGATGTGSPDKGIDYTTGTFAGGMPTTLSSGAVRNAFFPISGTVVEAVTDEDGIMGTGFERLTDGRIVLTSGAGAGFATGFLRDADGDVCYTTDDTGATMRNGFVRSPDGALVVVVDGAGEMRNGYLRDSSGLLVVTEDVPVATQNGMPRDAAGRLSVKLNAA